MASKISFSQGRERLRPQEYGSFLPVSAVSSFDVSFVDDKTLTNFSRIFFSKLHLLWFLHLLLSLRLPMPDKKNLTTAILMMPSDATVEIFGRK